jgi:hypothetical protein
VKAKFWETNRRIRSNILGYSCCISHLSIEFVLINAWRGGGLRDVTSSTGKHQSVVGAVFFRVKQIRAAEKVSNNDTSAITEKQECGSPFSAELEVNLVDVWLDVATDGGSRACRHFARVLRERNHGK